MNTNNKPIKGKITNQKTNHWTLGRSILLLLVTLDIIIVIAWFIYYRSEYAVIAKIFGSVWSAITTLLAFIGIKKARKISLVKLLGMLPAKIIIITYTLLILLLSGLFTLYAFKVHTMDVVTHIDNSPQSGVAVYLDNEWYGESKENGAFTIHSIQAGKYVLKVTHPQCRSDSVIIYVPMWKLKSLHAIHLYSIPSRIGNISIQSSYDGTPFNGASITVDGQTQDERTRAILKDLSVGLHHFKLSKIYNNMLYEGEKQIYIQPDITLELDINLRLIGPLYSLRIQSVPEGAHIFINGKPCGTTDRTVELPSNSYTIRITKTGYHSAERNIHLTENDIIHIPLSEK